MREEGEGQERGGEVKREKDAKRERERESPKLDVSYVSKTARKPKSLFCVLIKLNFVV
jgi:hypothetical protein